jgi:hypothetical protein
VVIETKSWKLIASAISTLDTVTAFAVFVLDSADAEKKD